MNPERTAIKSGHVRQVSVVIPAFNQGMYLAEAIESALAQTYRDFEIIVIDDGSTDGTHAIALQYGDAIRYYRQENQGLASARNAGVRQASHEYIALLDSDDQWLPTFLESMVALVEEHPEAAVYYCRARCMDADGNDLPQILSSSSVPHDAMYEALLRASFILPSTVLMRRSVALSAGLFDPSFRRCQDWELWLRILQQGRTFIGFHECLVRYRLHENSLSADPASGQQAHIAAAKKHFGPDDGSWGTWSSEKRRAYGGVYRYHALSFLQHMRDWQKCAVYLRKAFLADPTLAMDLDLFYELALGTQPVGYRGTPYQLKLGENAENVIDALARVFGSSSVTELSALRRQAYGTAYCAIGLVAYNTAQLAMSRVFLFKAILSHPGLCLSTGVIGNLIKSLLGLSALNWLRRSRTALGRLGAT